MLGSAAVVERWTLERCTGCGAARRSPLRPEACGPKEPVWVQRLGNCLVSGSCLKWMTEVWLHWHRWSASHKTKIPTLFFPELSLPKCCKTGWHLGLWMSAPLAFSLLILNMCYHINVICSRLLFFFLSRGSLSVCCYCKMTEVFPFMNLSLWLTHRAAKEKLAPCFLRLGNIFFHQSWHQLLGTQRQGCQEVESIVHSYAQ